MLHFSRSVSILGAPLALAALLACVAPAGAALTTNSLTLNSLTANALTTTGSPLGDLNGVVVEAVVLPDATR